MSRKTDAELTPEQLASRPPHPFWCDDCGARAGFKIPGAPIPHFSGCPREDEDPEAAHDAAVAWCLETGGAIP
jgi:uncharacterized protein YlaI